MLNFDRQYQQKKGLTLTHFVHVNGRINLPQPKIIKLIIWLSGFWALENPKIVRCHYCQICKESQILLSKSFIESNSHHFGPFPRCKIPKIDDLGPIFVKCSIFGHIFAF